MGDVVNLRMARKRAGRARKEREAEANRTLHAIPGAQRRLAEAQKQVEAQRLDAHRIEKPVRGDA